MAGIVIKNVDDPDNTENYNQAAGCSPNTQLADN